MVAALFHLLKSAMFTDLTVGQALSLHPVVGEITAKAKADFDFSLLLFTYAFVLFLFLKALVFVSRKISWRGRRAKRKSR